MRFEFNLCYDRQGQPITIPEWGRLHRDPDYVTVAQDKVGDRLISTIWLGLDLGWGPQPVIFETMIFGEDDARCVRYATEAQARDGHTVTVAFLREQVETER